METEINIQEIHNIVNKANKSLIKDLKLPIDFQNENNNINLLGLAYYHYNGFEKVNDLLEEAGILKEGTRQFVKRIENQKYEYKFMNAFYVHHISVIYGKIINSYNWLHEESTPRGKVYIQVSEHNDDPYITFYTSHFFDRFAVRTGMCETIFEAQKMREQVIYAFLNSKLSLKISQEFLESNGQIGIGTDKGLCLGLKYNKILFIKTFISTDMLKNNQNNQVKDTTFNIIEEYQKSIQIHENYVVDQFGTITNKITINRNDLCSCQSGKKYKKCCLK